MPLIVYKPQTSSLRNTILIDKKFLSKEKIPDVVKFVESLPKGPSGKILRREMKN